MIVLVAGATGSVGGKIVQGLLARGDQVRGLVRPATDCTGLEAASVEIARGDLKDPDSVARACHRVDVVISTASMSRRGDDAPENVDGGGNRNLIDAARAAGVRHFVLVSTVLSAADSPSPLLRAKADAETHLKASGMTYTILRANQFMDTWFGMLIEEPLSRGDPVVLVGESKRRHSFIAERDVTVFAIGALDQPAARNTTIAIGGPEALTFREAVGAYEEAIGHTLPVRSVPPGTPIPGLPEPVWGIAAALETFDSHIPMEETARGFGITLTSAREFARMSRIATAKV